MTKEEAVKKAAARTAAGVPTVVRKYLAGFQTLAVACEMAKTRRNNVERAANGKQRKTKAAYIARGAGALAKREERTNKKAYAVELFAESPDKRVAVPDARHVVILSDLQIPFEDPAAVEQALQVVRSLRPDTVVLNGDIIDCYAESAFLKDTDKAMASIPETHVRVRELMDHLKDVPQKIWMGGNHEDRWRRLLWGGGPTALMMLRAHQRAAGVDIDLVDPVGSFEKLFHMADNGTKYYPYSHRLYLAEKNLVVTHGKYVSRHSGYSAKRTWEWLGQSCIVGHTHRLGSYLITQDGKPQGAWENGCLCQLEPEYDDAPNWQQGFSVVKINGPEFHVIQVPIIRRSGKPIAIYHGDEVAA